MDGFLLVLKCLQKKDIEAEGQEVQVRREIEVGFLSSTYVLADKQIMKQLRYVDSNRLEPNLIVKSPQHHPPLWLVPRYIASLHDDGVCWARRAIQASC